KGLGPEFEEPPRQVIAVVGTVRETGLANADTAVMYVPQSQVADGLTKLAASVLPPAWAIRTAADPMALRGAIEREFRAVDSLVGLYRQRTMEQVIAAGMAREDF